MFARSPVTMTAKSLINKKTYVFFVFFCENVPNNAKTTTRLFFLSLSCVVALFVVVAVGFVFARLIILNCVYGTANGQLH